MRDGGPYWLTPDWPAPAPVRSLSTLRSGGSSQAPYDSLNLAAHVGDEADAVAANRHALVAAAGLPAEPVWLDQVHGTAVRNLDAAGSAGPADAAVTRRPGRVCAILTADCLPVILAARSGEVVAAAHAGWRGLAAGVIEAAVAAMGLPPGQIVAWLGPAIGPWHFEIGPEVRDTLLAADPGAGPAVRPNLRGRCMADLDALARSRLTRLGVTSVHGGGECTWARADRYFSYRRDGRTGRQATLIWLEPPSTG